MWMPSRDGVLKRITASFELVSKVSGSVNGKGGTTTRTPTWKPPARSQLRELAAGDPVQQLADRREQALLLDADRRIAEARGELERVDAVGVDDAVDVDVADVAFVAERGSIFFSVALKILLGSLQNIAVPISPVDGPMSPGNSFLCSKLTLIGVTNSVPLKNAPVATSTPRIRRCSWNWLILSDQALL